MKSRNLWCLVALVVLTMLSIAGCSGGKSGGSPITEQGTVIKFAGNVPAPSGAALAAAKSAKAASGTAIGSVQVFNAYSSTSKAALGTADINSDGSFSGLSVTLPATKSVIVFKATINGQSALYDVMPIDLSNPPSGLSANNVTVAINAATTTAAANISKALGFATGIIGDGVYLNSAAAFTNVVTTVTQFGGQALSYSSNGISFSGSASSSNLLPAQDVKALDATSVKELKLTGTVTAVAIPDDGKPVVSFQVTNAQGKGVKGLPSTTVAMGLLKLVPGVGTTSAPAADGGVNTWVSYMQTSATGTPSTEKATTVGGIFSDNGDGSYTYKFNTNVKNAIAPTALPANLAVDVTYNNTLTHRLGVIISGSLGVNDPISGAALTIANAENIVYDFVPATPTVQPTVERLVADSAACQSCHDKPFSFHGGTRFKVEICVLCHNQQHGNNATAYTTDNGTPNSNGKSIELLNGIVTANLAPFIHRIHNGENTTWQGIVTAGGLTTSEITYPQDVRNCTKCHTANVPQGGNWQTKPSIQACGACHDGINFATGAGTTLDGKSSGHIGGAQANDQACGLCHSAASIASYHIPTTAPDSNADLFGGTNAHTNIGYLAAAGQWPAGVDKYSWDVKSVQVNNNNPSITFRFLKNGSPVAFQNTSSQTYGRSMLPNTVGSPTIEFAWSTPQDTATAPVDFNKTASVYLMNAFSMNGAYSSNPLPTQTATVSAPDASGYYTVTLINTTIPSNAAILTGGIGYGYGTIANGAKENIPLTVTNAAAFPFNTTNRSGGLVSNAQNVWKTAAGFTGRRGFASYSTSAGRSTAGIVSTVKCNNCHGGLGANPTFHSTQRNDAATCQFCHAPGKADNGYAYNSNYFIHALHGSSQRTNQYGWQAVLAPDGSTDGYWNVTYPGVLNHCEQCHNAGYYDYSNSTYTAATMSNMLYVVGAAAGSTITNPVITNPYVAAGAVGSEDLVMSPITAACASCHDSVSDQAHFKANGGSFYVTRTAALANQEQCLICHAAGKVAAIKDVHYN